MRILYDEAGSDPRRAWIEASTKGAVLLFTAAEIETLGVNAGISPGTSGLLGGMGGGVAQAYATMCVPTRLVRSR